MEVKQQLGFRIEKGRRLTSFVRDTGDEIQILYVRVHSEPQSGAFSTLLDDEFRMDPTRRYRGVACTPRMRETLARRGWRQEGNDMVLDPKGQP